MVGWKVWGKLPGPVNCFQHGSVEWYIWYVLQRSTIQEIESSIYIWYVLQRSTIQEIESSNLACCVVADSHFANTPAGHGFSNLLARAPHCRLRSSCGSSDALCKFFMAAFSSSLKTLIRLVRDVIPSDKLTVEWLLAKPGFDEAGVSEASLFGLS